VWKFSHRAVVADWSYVATRPPSSSSTRSWRARWSAGRDHSDPSYQFFSLLQRGQR
jgi:hypothetical protein